MNVMEMFGFANVMVAASVQNSQFNHGGPVHASTVYELSSRGFASSWSIRR
jgi:hypothetical protein